MRHPWIVRLSFRLFVVAWAAGSSVAASRPMEAGVVEEQNSRSDCQPEQVALLIERINVMLCV